MFFLDNFFTFESMTQSDGSLEIRFYCLPHLALIKLNTQSYVWLRGFICIETDKGLDIIFFLFIRIIFSKDTQILDQSVLWN